MQMQLTAILDNGMRVTEVVAITDFEGIVPPQELSDKAVALLRLQVLEGMRECVNRLH